MIRPGTFRNPSMAVGLAAALLAAASALPARDAVPGYLHDSGSRYHRPNWMSFLSDATPLDRISMVGTHDSGAAHDGDIVAAQTLSISSQLDLGIRVLDMRCCHRNDSLFIYHGVTDQHMTARDFVGEVVKFLKANPTETVLIRVKEENRSAPNKNSFRDAFLEQIYNYYGKSSPGIFWQGWGMPSLKDLRGKIVILNNFNGSEFGMDYNNADIQDQYTVKTNWDLYDKWLAVKAELDKAWATGGGRGLYMNYLSASTGSFPYFVASGKSDPSTNGPQLLTGFTTPGWKDKYPDFPRVSCFMGICSIAFMGTNPLATERVKALQAALEADAKKRGKPVPPEYVGILMADFPGPELVEAVIRVNALTGKLP